MSLERPDSPVRDLSEEANAEEWNEEIRKAWGLLPEQSDAGPAAAKSPSHAAEEPSQSDHNSQSPAQKAADGTPTEVIDHLDRLALSPDPEERIVWGNRPFVTLTPADDAAISDFQIITHREPNEHHEQYLQRDPKQKEEPHFQIGLLSHSLHRAYRWVVGRGNDTEDNVDCTLTHLSSVR